MSSVFFNSWSAIDAGRIVNMGALKFATPRPANRLFPAVLVPCDVLLAGHESRLIQADLIIRRYGDRLCWLSGSNQRPRHNPAHRQPSWRPNSLLCPSGSLQRRFQSNYDKQQLTPAAHELSGIPTGRNPRLYLPLESSIGVAGCGKRLASLMFLLSNCTICQSFWILLE